MEQIFITLFRYFHKRKNFFWIFFVSVCVLLGWGASRISLEEDVTRFFPNDERVEEFNYIFQHSKIAERVVLMVSVRDSSTAPQPEKLTALADTLVARITNELPLYVKAVRSKVDSDMMNDLFGSFQNHLPIYLNEDDYKKIDSIIQPDVARRVLHENYRMLLSPSGMVMKNTIVNDPLGFSFLVLAKLQQLQYDDNFILYDDYIMTKDLRHIILFVQPMYPAGATGKNTIFLNQLDEIIAETGSSYSDLMVSYFGATSVAVGNSRQLQKDTILTISIMLVLLLVVLIGFFRKKRIPFLILVPVAFGALFAICCVTFFKSSLSILALAVGAVILGIAVDYSLHFLVLLIRARDTEEVIKDIVRPLTIGSATTVLAFLCLQFTNAEVLRDVGLFSGLSLVGAALCTLIFLPHLVNQKWLGSRQTTWIDTLAAYSFSENKVLVYAVLLITPFLLYFAPDVKFNKDMNALNFMTRETVEAQRRLETLNASTLTSVYVVTSGNTLEAALRKNERMLPVLETLKASGTINKISSVSSFLISDSLQRVRLKKWDDYWNQERKQAIRSVVNEQAAALGFSHRILANFDSLISRQYMVMDRETQSNLRYALFDERIIELDGQAKVISLAHVDPKDKKTVYETLKATPSRSFDKQIITNLFVEYVNADFNFIVTFTAILVFVVLLISYGRIEITLITFVPMFFTWIWILGIMAIFGIEFNIINIMVSTFIFGLGDDYSIFIMDGLQQEYRAGKHTLVAIRSSIFLSAFTTISGLGVLIFAQHPALKSIAFISIIGIVCVFVMAQTLEPFFFRVLISDRAKRGLSPVTFFGLIKTAFTFGFFVIGSLVLTLVGILLKIIPIGRKQIQLFYRNMICLFMRALVYGSFNVKKIIINKHLINFKSPAIIISNHSSFLDILFTTMLHPRLILLTNEWVYNSLVFGGVVRLAGYYSIAEGADESLTTLRKTIADGNSIVVFPEGTRSRDGKVQRFHKGAFFLAEALKLPVQPILIHGAHDVVTKGDLYLNDGQVTLEFLPRIEHDHNHFGTRYSERAKNISQYYKTEHLKLVSRQETPEYFKPQLYANYIYKGPVLEWYMRIKVRLEKNYTVFDRLIPRKASILDLGCGYGFLCYMLQFVSEHRTITGVDYDEEKIATAQNGYKRSDKLNFYSADVMEFTLARYDVIIISDVLHYLSGEEQEILLLRCFKALEPNGKLIIRDGDRDLEQRHKKTALTEMFSVKLLKFNKAKQNLHFISGEALVKLAESHGLQVTIQDDTKYTSNVIFVISKPEVIHAAV